MFNHWIRSLSAQLWVTSVAALAVSLTLLAVIVIHAFNHFPNRTLGGHEEMERASDVASGIDFDATGRPVSARLLGKAAWVFDALPADFQYRVLDEQGRTVLASANAREGAAWITGDLSEAVDKVVPTTIGSKPFQIMTIRVPHGHAVFYVQTITSARLMETLIGTKVQEIPAIVRTTLIITTIIFGLTLTLALHRLLKPLREASRAAALITPRNLATRLSLKGVPSEIKPLIRAFNEALRRLERGFAVQQQFLASAAHELQTPLTLMRGQIELQPDIEDKEALLREIDLMARQVRQLLHLAEVSESQNFTFGEVNSVDVAQDVVDYLERKADRNQVKLMLEVPVTPSPIWADRGALFILLKNLVENAINVSPPNSVVWLIVDDVSIEVRDEGPGIKQEHIPFLFKRYWRAPDATHDGAGLGLAICKEIAIAHEWKLTVGRLLSGTKFSVLFGNHGNATAERSPSDSVAV
ncbi:sensor histidine kinase [Paraburkholderia sp.]|uniref:sensor histidine kinase n=1 Tax=Paraburkholderia sp. TaxID=1926495 RepID=UPI003D6F3F2A